MGTRNLTVVVVGGKHKIAQYGQWNGYPSGQGKTVLKFCQNILSCFKEKNHFINQLEKVRFVSNDEIQKLYADVGVTTTSEFDIKYPYFSRDNGAKILEMVNLATSEVLIEDSIDFAEDSLFCEWAYVIDLDQNVLEVYRGFNKEPIGKNERFATYPFKNNDVNNQYYPIRLTKTFLLTNLPNEENFLKAFQTDIQYGVNCMKCNTFCEYAERTINFKCWACKN